MKKIEMPIVMSTAVYATPKEFKCISLSLWYKMRNDMLEELDLIETNIDLEVMQQLWKEYR